MKFHQKFHELHDAPYCNKFHELHDAPYNFTMPLKKERFSAETFTTVFSVMLSQLVPFFLKKSVICHKIVHYPTSLHVPVWC